MYTHTHNLPIRFYNRTSVGFVVATRALVDLQCFRVLLGHPYAQGVKPLVAPIASEVKFGGVFGHRFLAHAIQLPHVSFVDVVTELLRLLLVLFLACSEGMRKERGGRKKEEGRGEDYINLY